MPEQEDEVGTVGAESSLPPYIPLRVLHAILTSWRKGMNEVRGLYGEDVVRSNGAWFGVHNDRESGVFTITVSESGASLEDAKSGLAKCQRDSSELWRAADTARRSADAARRVYEESVSKSKSSVMDTSSMVFASSQAADRLESEAVKAEDAYQDLLDRQAGYEKFIAQNGPKVYTLTLEELVDGLVPVTLE